jgi:hypothetical protein
VHNPVSWRPESSEGRDLDADAEQKLADHVAQTFGHDFVFVTGYPVNGGPSTHTP